MSFSVNRKILISQILSVFTVLSTVYDCLILQRLKAALQSNITPSSSMKINHIFKIVEEVKQEQQQHPIVSQDSLSVVSDTISSPEDAATPA